MLNSRKTNLLYMAIAAILLLARCGVLPITPLTDTTEARYGGIAKNMVETGDWITPHLWFDGQYVPFLGKPPLAFWLEAISVKIFGENEFALRLPTLLVFTTLLIFLWLVLNRYSNSDIAWRSVFFTLSSIVLYVCAGLVIVDLLLAFGVGCSLLAYYAFLQEEDSRLKKFWSRLVFIMLAVGFMTKGPVAIILFGLPVFIWTAVNKQWNSLKYHAWISATIIFLAMTVPWFWMAELKNPGFLKYFFVNENFLRFISHDYGDRYGSGHEQVRGTAILMMFAAAAPWSFYAVFRLWQSGKRFRLRSILFDKKSSFFLCVVLADTLFWALARQLLITYMFPMVALFNVWLAMLIDNQDKSKSESNSQQLFAWHAFLLCFLATISLVVVSPIIAKNKSTKAIIHRCEEMPSFADSKIYFVHRIPYSAYFYGSDRVAIHRSQLPEQSFQAIKNGDNLLGIIDQKNYSKIPQNMRDQMFYIDKFGKYIIFRMANSTHKSN